MVLCCVDPVCGANWTAAVEGLGRSQEVRVRYRANGAGGFDGVMKLDFQMVAVSDCNESPLIMHRTSVSRFKL